MVVWVWALGGTACERFPLTDGLPTTTDCSSCHGSPGDPAPPAAVDGSNSTSDIGVGAHQSHLRSSLGLPAPRRHVLVCETGAALHRGAVILSNPVPPEQAA